jgi:hypothetical protein
MNQLGTQKFNGTISRAVAGRVTEVGATGSVVVSLDSNSQEVYFMTSEFKGTVRVGQGVTLYPCRRGDTIEWYPA